MSVKTLRGRVPKDSEARVYLGNNICAIWPIVIVGLEDIFALDNN